MTKSEYRRMIEQHKKSQRQQRIMRRVLVLLAAVCLLVFVAAFTTTAAGRDEQKTNKYYTNLCVAPGSTLSDIADVYMDSAHYEDRDDYIYEVCSINHLDQADEIRAGEYLVVPYYSAEVK